MQEFAAEWRKLISEEPTLDPRSPTLSEKEIEAWEALFRRNDQNSKD